MPKHETPLHYYYLDSSLPNLQTDLQYESTVEYGGRLYLLIATGTKHTLELRSNLPTLHTFLVLFFFITLSSSIGVFLVVRNKAQLDQEKALVDTHTKLVGHMCHAMRNPLHSIMFIAKVIHESTHELGNAMSTPLCDNVDAMATKQLIRANSKDDRLESESDATNKAKSSSTSTAAVVDSKGGGQVDAAVAVSLGGGGEGGGGGGGDGEGESVSMSVPESQHMCVASVTELAEAVSVLDATAGSMYDLINSFMDFNQLNVCDLSLNTRTCDCIAVAATVFAQHRIIHRDHVDMAMTNELGPCAMELDLVRFRQVLSNGFGNSCKVTESGYVNLRICWSSPAHEAVDFIIEDTGPGLMGVDPEKLFKEYERGAQAKSFKAETASTGLGLTISRKIAVAFGGSLHLEDRRARDGVQGARFVFRLPSARMIRDHDVAGGKHKRTSAAATPAGGSSPEVAGGGDVVVDMPPAEGGGAEAAKHTAEAAGRGGAESEDEGQMAMEDIDISQIKVAFAEDDPANHAILKRMLKRIGCEVVGAFHDGKPLHEFLCTPGNVMPDVTLADVVMGTMNGDDAVKGIRKSGCKVQCVALTGQSMPADLEHLMSCGFDAVLPKPYSTEDLEAVIRERACQQQR
jgi:signal transduction histidine kinase/CheY-like chemotaxis protein